MGNLFAIIGIGAGLYCLYAYIMMKNKNEINKNVLLPKGVDANKCKDTKAYIKAVSLPLLVLAIVLIVYGGIEVINEYFFKVGNVLFAALCVVAVVLIWFAAVTKNANKKYFGI